MIDRQREKNVRRNRRACIVHMAAGVLMLQASPAVLEGAVQHPLGHLRADVFGQVVDAGVHGAGGQEAGGGVVLVTPGCEWRAGRGRHAGSTSANAPEMMGVKPLSTSRHRVQVMRRGRYVVRPLQPPARQQDG